MGDKQGDTSKHLVINFAKIKISLLSLHSSPPFRRQTVIYRRLCDAVLALIDAIRGRGGAVANCGSSTPCGAMRQHARVAAELIPLPVILLILNREEGMRCGE